MSSPVIVLVEDDIVQSGLITRALERRVLLRPVLLRDGESAVLWTAANECSICLLDYDLPGIDGLETLVRIHQRKPNLPIVMLSNAASEKVAIAAFRAGVVDYLPKVSGFPEAAAERAAQILQPLDPQSRPILTPAPPGVLEQLLQPTYQNRLRVVGRQLDLYGYRSINLVEVAGGFLVRAFPATSRTPEALEFSDRDFPQLMTDAITKRGENNRLRVTNELLPSGYEDFFRALGYRLDKRIAEAITVAELSGFVAVSGLAKADEFEQTRVQPFQEILGAEQIGDLLDEAYRHRAPVPEPRRSPGLARIVGR